MVAESEKDSELSTMRNVFIRQKETEFIINAIKCFSNENRVNSLVDVGCGNGYTLSLMGKFFSNFSISGVEYTDSLREIALRRFKNSDVSIFQGDIRFSDTLPKNKYDILLCQRVLINLLDPEDQKKALENLIDLVNIGGLLIFCESFKSGLINLNNARKEFGLEPILSAYHNLYLDDNFFETKRLSENTTSTTNTLSTHFFVARVLHAAFLKAKNEEFVRNSHFVSFFSQALPDSCGNYSPLRFLSFRKLD
jgi:SAM-dependent methyltransferase